MSEHEEKTVVTEKSEPKVETTTTTEVTETDTMSQPEARREEYRTEEGPIVEETTTTTEVTEIE